MYVYFPVLLSLSVSVKSLAVKTASEMTYIVSGGALNSTHSLNPAKCSSGRISKIGQYFAKLWTRILCHFSGMYDVCMKVLMMY